MAQTRFCDLPEALSSSIKNPGDLKNWMVDEMRKRGVSTTDLLKLVDKDEFNRQLIERTILNFRNGTGIFSLSRIPDNLLMWAHYSNSHKGVVFEFDINHDFFETHAPQKDVNQLEVIYSTHRPKVRINPDEKDEEIRTEIMKAIFYTKSIDWSYEKEYRLIKPLFGLAPEAKDINGYDIYLFEIPRESIKRIIFGCRMSSQDQHKVKGVLSANHLSEIAISSAVLDQKDFKIDII